MNSLERMMNTFAGKPVDRLAVQPIIMTFAARRAGMNYYDYVTDYRKLVEAQLKVIEEFDLDVIQLISDPAREAADCGAEVKWFPDQPPAHDPNNPFLKAKTDLLKLKQPDPLGGGRMHDRVKGAALAKEKVGNEMPILGWIEGPVAEAADLRGINEIMLDLVDDPEFVRDLFEFILEMELNFAKAQIEAGVNIMGIGDAAASLVSPKLYQELVFPYEQKMIEGLHALGCPVRLHICGNINHLLPFIKEMDVEMIDIDCLTDLRLARSYLRDEITILGNMDPVTILLQGTPEDVFKTLGECHQIVGKKFIIGAGCEVPPNTPPENLKMMAEYARHQEAFSPRPSTIRS